MGSVFSLPFDFRPLGNTKVISEDETYRPARGRYALVHASCKNATTVNIRRYDSDGEMISGIWLNSKAVGYRAHRNVGRRTRTRPTSQSEISSSMIPRRGYVLEGFLYNISRQYDLHYTFRSLPSFSPSSDYDFVIAARGNSRTDLSRDRIVPVKLSSEHPLGFLSGRSASTLTGDQLNFFIDPQQGFIGYYRPVGNLSTDQGWTILDDNSEIFAENPDIFAPVGISWQASVVEYGPA